MKLLLENWRKYLKEDMEEGLAQKLAMGAAMLGGLAGSPDVKADSGVSNTSTHQVDYKSNLGKVINNGDGTGSVTFKYDGSAGGDISNLLQAAKDKATTLGLVGVGDADLLDANGNPARDFYEFSDVKFLKFTGNLNK